MNLQKTGVILLALLLAAMAMIPMVSASENNSDALNVDTSLNLSSQDVQFDGLSQKDVQIPLGGTELKSISPSIKKYEIITIDVSTLKKQLQSGQKIPIHLKGIPYFMNLHEDTIYPSAETGVYTFTGTLENSKDGDTIPGSEAHLTMDDTGVIGKISLDAFTYWYIDEIERDRSSASPGSIQYTYYSGDVEQTMSPMGEDRYVLLPSGESKPVTGLSDEELRQFIADSYVYSTAEEKLPGARMDNDAWVVLPSGESKNRDDLSQEESAWLMNQQRVMKKLELESLSANESGKTPVTETPLSSSIVFLAVGIVAAGLHLKRSG